MPRTNRDHFYRGKNTRRALNYSKIRGSHAGAACVRCDALNCIASRVKTREGLGGMMVLGSVARKCINLFCLPAEFGKGT